MNTISRRWFQHPQFTCQSMSQTILHQSETNYHLVHWCIRLCPWCIPLPSANTTRWCPRRTTNTILKWYLRRSADPLVHYWEGSINYILGVKKFRWLTRWHTLHDTYSIPKLIILKYPWLQESSPVETLYTTLRCYNQAYAWRRKYSSRCIQPPGLKTNRCDT